MFMTPSSVFLFQSVWEQGVSLGMLHSFQFVLRFQVSSFGCLYLLTYNFIIFFSPDCRSGKKKFALLTALLTEVLFIRGKS